MAREQLQTLTEPMYFILLAIAHSPAHGYEIMKAVSDISGGRVTVGAGTMYALLTRFEKETIVRCKGYDGRRKTYELTAHGREMLEREYLRLVDSITAYENYVKGGSV